MLPNDPLANAAIRRDRRKILVLKSLLAAAILALAALAYRAAFSLPKFTRPTEMVGVRRAIAEGDSQDRVILVMGRPDSLRIDRVADALGMHIEHWYYRVGDRTMSFEMQTDPGSSKFSPLHVESIDGAED